MIAIFSGPEIRELRKRLGLTPTEFAVKVGATASAVSYWESGARTPKVEYLRRMNELAVEVGMIDPQPTKIHKGNGKLAGIK